MFRPWRGLSLAAVFLMVCLPVSAQAFSNGYLPKSAVSPIASGVKCQAPAGELASSAAAGFNTMALAARKQLPINGCDSAYRSYSRQQYWRSYWCSRGLCGNAAVPGTSNHGLGLAVDVPQWVRGYIDSTHGAYGFSKPCSDAPQEWWHVKFCAPFHRPDPGVHQQRPVLRVGSGGPGQAPWVKKAQKLLNRHGAKLHADGDFGQHTKDAIKAFQKANHLPSDGVVGKRTWRHLREPVVKPKPKPKPPSPHHKGPVFGIDVSANNGSIDWKAVKDSHKGFVIAKANEGDYIDPYWNRGRVNAIKAAHLVPGAYDFLRPRADRSGAQEARFYIQAVTHAGYGDGFIRPVADIETTTLSSAGTCAYLHSWTKRVRRKLHVKPIVYTYVNFARTVLAGCGSWLKKLGSWRAAYGVKQIDNYPWPHRARIEQYSDQGHVGGVNGYVDLDRIPGGIDVLHKLTVSAPKKLERKPKAKVPAVRGQVAKPEPLAAIVTPPEPKPLPDGDTVRAPEPSGNENAARRAARIAIGATP
jgi:GH25 family lysozyme M1 (1,4-beta-N-acetylmuramidase)